MVKDAREEGKRKNGHMKGVVPGGKGHENCLVLKPITTKLVASNNTKLLSFSSGGQKFKISLIGLPSED